MRHSILIALAFFAAACNPTVGNDQRAQGESVGRMMAPVLLSEDARDAHSYARPAEARVTHVALDLKADFNARRVGGTATLDIQAADGAKEVVLDSKGLEVGSVTDGRGRTLQHEIGPADPVLGAPLIVQLDGAKQVKIAYSSAPGAAALQWLSPEQTAGKKQPFLFTQGQAILNRGWIPTQDSPGIRQTWEARIIVPEPLKAVMSGDNLAPEGEKVAEAQGGGRAFRFRMDKPVAPYLIALAVGDITFQQLGPRTGVYAEPSMIEAAAYELADTEKMMTAAEELYGSYRWGRYDMLMLPPSFPYGGMENPTLTFLTPTMIAGDRSLVSLVAHELAHSWSGNLVTNATWSDYWLNEGFTTYFESRIMEKLYGAAAANREISLGWDSLQTTIAAEGGPRSPSTRLHLPLVGQDPDPGSNSIAYEKGAVFLRTLEQLIGRERFDTYLRSYFDRHAFEPVTSSRFLADLRTHLVKGDSALERKLMLDQWIYQPGIPANVAPPPAAAFAAVDGAAKAYGGGGPIAAVPFKSWGTSERLRFLNSLPRRLPTERLTELNRSFGLGEIRNSEVLSAWLQLALANRYEPAVPVAERFLTSMGRRKFVAPLFKTLVAQGDWGRPIATRIYAEARPTYHQITIGTIDEMLAGKD